MTNTLNNRVVYGEWLYSIVYFTYIAPI